MCKGNCRTKTIAKINLKQLIHLNSSDCNATICNLDHDDTVLTGKCSSYVVKSASQEKWSLLFISILHSTASTMSSSSSSFTQRHFSMSAFYIDISIRCERAVCRDCEPMLHLATLQRSVCVTLGHTATVSPLVELLASDLQRDLLCSDACYVMASYNLWCYFHFMRLHFLVMLYWEISVDLT